MLDMNCLTISERMYTGSMKHESFLAPIVFDKESINDWGKLFLLTSWTFLNQSFRNQTINPQENRKN